MSELTLHTGGQGDWDTIHITWFDENNVSQKTRLDIRILNHDKPRTLELRLNEVVVATIPRKGS